MISNDDSRARSRHDSPGEEVADPVDIPVAGRAPTDASGAESRLERASNSSNGGLDARSGTDRQRKCQPEVSALVYHSACLRVPVLRIAGPSPERGLIPRQALDKQTSKQTGKQAVLARKQCTETVAPIGNPPGKTPPIGHPRRRVSRTAVAQVGRRAGPGDRRSAKQLQVVPDRA